MDLHNYSNAFPAGCRLICCSVMIEVADSTQTAAMLPGHTLRRSMPSSRRRRYGSQRHKLIVLNCLRSVPIPGSGYSADNLHLKISRLN